MITLKQQRAEYQRRQKARREEGKSEAARKKAQREGLAKIVVPPARRGRVTRRRARRAPG